MFLAALAARWAGADVLLLEKSPTTFGGTTRKSGGVFWIPNNHKMQEIGLQDPKDPALRYMAKLSYPKTYKPLEHKLGLNELEFDWLEKFYDTGSCMISGLAEKGVLPHLSFFKDNAGEPFYDYQYNAGIESDNRAPRGRALGAGLPTLGVWGVKIFKSISATLETLVLWLAEYKPSLREAIVLNRLTVDVSSCSGRTLVSQLRKGLGRSGVGIKMGTAVEGLLINPGGAVVGVMTHDWETGQSSMIRARKGVIFACGGFGGNRDMCRKHLPVNVQGSCASPGNTGDFHLLAEMLGCRFGNMNQAWGSETYLEERIREGWEAKFSIFNFRGDGFFIVNSRGERIFNEKMPYDERYKMHSSEENMFCYLVADRRTVELYGFDAVPSLPNPSSGLYIKGATIDELSANIARRLAEIAPSPHSSSGLEGAATVLAGDFSLQLTKTLSEFNIAAEAGRDEKFGRGESEAEKQWSNHHQTNDTPNHTMYPINPSGPFYAVILAPALLDTKGGPLVDCNGQVLDMKDQPIPGLYGAGNAVSSLSGQAYWSAGATIGIAMVTGWVAGEAVARSNVKDV